MLGLPQPNLAWDADPMYVTLALANKPWLVVACKRSHVVFFSTWQAHYKIARQAQDSIRGVQLPTCKPDSVLMKIIMDI